MMRYSNKTHGRKQTGFTLVEIAIVLVIIGLLLGGVLRGQQLIFNSRVKSTYNLSRDLSAAISGYQDRHRALPGDDRDAANHGFTAQPGVAISNGDTNGLIGAAGAVPACAANSALEQCQALYHLRLAGFITGSNTVSPLHAFGGNVVISRLDVFGIASWANATAAGVCWQNLTNEVALAIDQAYDDGFSTSGPLRGTSAYEAQVVAGNPQGVVDWTCSQI